MFLVEKEFFVPRMLDTLESLEIYNYCIDDVSGTGTVGSKMDFSCRLVKPAVKNRVRELILTSRVSNVTSRESMLNLKSFDSWLSLS